MKKSPGGKKKVRSIQKKGFSLNSSQNMVRARDSMGRSRFAKKGTKGAEKSQTIYMPIQQATDGKTAEAVVVNDEKEAHKVDVTNVKIVEKWFNLLHRYLAKIK